MIDADYRKAPENPFPAALEDAEDVFNWVHQHPELYDLENVFASGFSAGGNIALVMSSTLGAGKIAGVINAAGITDCTQKYPAPDEPRGPGSVVISPRDFDLLKSAYMVPPQRDDDPRISPFFASPESFPRHILLACGTADTLYTPNANFVRKMTEAGHPDIEFATVRYLAHNLNPEAKDKIYNGTVRLIERAVASTRV